MRDRLLARLNQPTKADDWVRVLAVPGHRELLAIIARHSPASIGALAELAGRAQPNVSRALSALSAASLIEVVVSGRRSTPRMTELGASKVRELGILDEAAPPAEAAVSGAELFTIDVAPDASKDKVSEAGDTVTGGLVTWLWFNSAKEQAAARNDGDLNAIGCRVLENWWRIHYRRDAPYRLWDFVVDGEAGTSYDFLATVSGAQVVLQARAANGRSLNLQHASRTFAVGAFEQLLLDEFLRPLASHHWLSGRSAMPLHALLRRVDDSRAYPAERAFCRTAGALGLAPYDLSDDTASQIRELLVLIPEEDARLDFSSAVLADFLVEGQHWASQELERHRERNALPGLARLRSDCTIQHNAPVRPYRRGYDLARKARALLKLESDVPAGGVDGLSKLFGGNQAITLSPDAPGALRAFQSIEGDAPTFVVENEGSKSSAFVLARAIGDYVAFGNHASCVADLYTDRQAVGRAFAAEFMAPREAVVEMIEVEDRPVAVIADHFGVSPSVIHRQYENSFNG